MTSNNNAYLDQDGGITVEIEWYFSHLLHYPEYSHLDDVVRKQKLQMQREIQTLQQENYTLEKQLHSFQPGATGQPSNNSAQSGPHTKSFDNPSASSSTASSGVGTSISSLNTNQSTNNMTATAGNSQANIVKKYMEQKYGGTNPVGGANSGMASSGLNNINNNNISSGNLGGFTSGLTNLLTSNQDKNNGAAKLGSGLFGPISNNNPNNSNLNQMGMNSETDSPLGGSLSSITSQLTSGFASLKLSATNFQAANKFTSKLMNPFS